MLNDAKHREARRVLYDEPRSVSYEILGLQRSTPDDGASINEIKSMSRDIVRSDFNENGTLVYHNLLDGTIFVREYYWVILKTWHLLAQEIMERRKGVGPPNYMEHFEEIHNMALEYAKEHQDKVYQEFSRPEGSQDKDKKPKVNKAPIGV
jgi:hypothetical protein